MIQTTRNIPNNDGELFTTETIQQRVVNSILEKNPKWIYTSVFAFLDTAQKRIIKKLLKKTNLKKEDVSYNTGIYNEYELYTFPGNWKEDFSVLFSYDSSVLWRRVENVAGLIIFWSLERVTDVWNWIGEMKWLDVPKEEPKSYDKVDIVEYFWNEKDAYVDTNTSRKTLSDFRSITSSLYPDLDIELLVDTFMESDENILVLLWTAGTWKTTFIKYLMQRICEKQIANTVSYVKDEKLLEREQLWMALKDSQSELVILDDLDNGLQARSKGAKESVNFVNKLLSFSDWLFENKTKIIITSNAVIDEIDSAIIRPGRCFDILNFKPLLREQAEKIWTKEFKLKDFNTYFDTHKVEVTQALLMSKYKEYMSKTIDRKYLKDKSISLKKV